MPQTANGAFTIDKRDTTATPWEGGQMTRTRWHKTFTGDLTGTSVIEATMLGLDDGGPAVYVGLERIAGTLHGREGTFILLHAATNHGNDNTTLWTIVRGSGTGQLAGIRGEAEILAKHGFVLTYDFDA